MFLTVNKFDVYEICKTVLGIKKLKTSAIVKVDNQSPKFSLTKNRPKIE